MTERARPQSQLAKSHPTSQWPTIIRAGVVTAGVTFLIIMAAILMGSMQRGDYQTPPLAVWIHLAMVIPAVPLGAYILWSKKGGARHKLLGRIWGIMMMVTAIDSFWIRSVTGTISPIHIFSVVTLISVPLAVYHIRRGNVEAHRRAIRGVYIGLIVAGFFSLMPGRLLSTMVFG